ARVKVLGCVAFWTVAVWISNVRTASAARRRVSGLSGTSSTPGAGAFKAEGSSGRVVNRAWPSWLRVGTAAMAPSRSGMVNRPSLLNHCLLRSLMQGLPGDGSRLANLGAAWSRRLGDQREVCSAPRRTYHRLPFKVL